MTDPPCRIKLRKKKEISTSEKRIPFHSESDQVRVLYVCDSLLHSVVVMEFILEPWRVLHTWQFKTFYMMYRQTDTYDKLLKIVQCSGKLLVKGAKENKEGWEAVAPLALQAWTKKELPDMVSTVGTVRKSIRLGKATYGYPDLADWLVDHAKNGSTLIRKLEIINCLLGSAVDANDSCMFLSKFGIVPQPIVRFAKQYNDWMFWINTVLDLITSAYRIHEATEKAQLQAIKVQNAKSTDEQREERIKLLAILFKRKTMICSFGKYINDCTCASIVITGGDANGLPYLVANLCSGLSTLTKAYLGCRQKLHHCQIVCVADGDHLIGNGPAPTVDSPSESKTRDMNS
eukprot:g20604.t1